MARVKTTSVDTPPNGQATLDDSRAWLASRINDGAACPCCAQFAKVYRRPLTGSMAYVLLLIERWTRTSMRTEWLHVPSYLSEQSHVGVAVRGGDWAKLVHWGLIEERPVVRADGARHAGYYRITQLGLDFVNDRVLVPKYVFLYNRKKLDRTTDKMVSIDKALGKNFNYAELMSADAAE